MKINCFLLFIPLLLQNCTSNNLKDKKDNSTTSSSIVQTFWTEYNIIAETEVIRKYRDNIRDTVIVCDLNQVKQTKDIPIDLLVDSLNVISIDDSKEFVKTDYQSLSVYLSENYICISAYNKFPLKLFSKKGAFIRNIEKSLSEHITIDNIYMDEKSNRIYILPSNENYILEYTYSNEFCNKIPLTHKNSHGSSIRINNKNKKILVITPFNNMTKHCIWIQDFKGNRIQSIAPYTYYHDISYTGNAALSHFHTGAIEYFHYRINNGSDFLYHFIENGNRLAPRFRMINTDKNTPYLVYELPNHYVIEPGQKQSRKESSSNKKIIINKVSLKGCAFNKFITNFGIALGEQHAILSTMHDGYFTVLESKSNIEKLINQTNDKNLNSNQKNNLNKLKLFINTNRNELILFKGKFK